MRRSQVLRGVQVVPEPRRVRAEDLVWPGFGPDYLSATRREPPIYTERDVEQLLLEVRQQSFEEGRVHGCDEGRASGYQTGFAAGIETGRQEVHQQVREQGQMLVTLADSLLRERARILISAGRDLVHLALTMAERIVRRSLPFEDEATLRAIREALAQVADAPRIVVRINPREMAHVQQNQDDLVALIAGDSRLELRADASVSPGGCIVDTPELHLDATVEALLERFDEVLTTWSEHVAQAANAPSGAADEAPQATDAASAAEGHTGAVAAPLDEQPVHPPRPEEPELREEGDAA